jgi:hypothetical protein
LVTDKDTSSTRGGTSSSTAPIIRYQDAAGHTFRFAASAAASRPTLYSVGEPVTVYYDPDRPYNAQLHGFLAQWMGPVMAIGMGLVFTLLGWMCVALLGKRA